ncbi:MAG: PAS domain S-box protein [Candidatus Hermodarchaeota archaeon]
MVLTADDDATTEEKEVLGYVEDDLIGQHSGKFVHPEDLKDLMKIPWSSRIKNTELFEFRFMKKDGTYAWLESRDKSFVDIDGKEKILTISRDITSRKKMELELKESEEKFRTIAEQSLMGVIILQEGNIKYANRITEEITGFPLQEILEWKDTDWMKRVYPEDLPIILERIRQRDAGEVTGGINAPYRLITKSGEMKWVLGYSHTISYLGKIAILGAIIDINEWMKSEQKLKESEEKFRTITEQIFLGIVIFQDGQIKYANEAVSKIVEFSNQELMEFSTEEIFNVIHPEDRRRALERYQKIIAGRKDVKPYDTFKMITKSGKNKWIESFDKLIPYGGKAAILTVFLDRTEQKESGQKLKESEERYRNLFEKAIVGILVSRRNRIILCNEQESKLFGYKSSSDLIGRRASEIIHEDDFPKLVEIAENIMAGNPMEHPIIFRGIRSDGKQTFIEALAIKFPFIAEDCILSYNIDVTERELAQQKLKQSEQRLRDSNKLLLETDNMRRNLIKSVSHELRTPVAVLTQAIRNIEDYGVKMPENMRKQAMKIISRNIRVLDDLIEDLLLASRIEDKRITLKWESYNPISILNEVLTQMDPQIKAKKMKIDIQSNEDIELLGDIKRISQIFRILIDNALKYSFEESTINIEAINYYKGKFNPQSIDGMLIQFQYFGRGIKKNDLPQLFDQYFRSKDVEDIPGTGLGLTLAKRLIELHEGAIYVESEYGKGSIFSVFLPKVGNK